VGSPHPKFAAQISTSPRNRGEVDQASRQTDSNKVVPFYAADFFLGFGLAPFGAASTSGPRSTEVSRPPVKV